MKKALFFPLQISLCTVGYLWATGSIIQAQVTSDGTVDTIVTPNGNVAEITGGETKGSNLFHSFQEFSVSTGNEAFFNNANSISNIFNRVTGGIIDITVDEAILGIEERTLSPNTNDINADSGSGIISNVSINTPDFNSIQGTTQLAENTIDHDSTVNQVCSRQAGTNNTLTIKGKGGIPPLAIEPLQSRNFLGNVDNSDDTEIKSRKPPSLKKIIPAQGVVVKEDGSIILTAYPTSETTARLPQDDQCQAGSVDSRNWQRQQN